MRFLVSFVWDSPQHPEGDSSWIWSRDFVMAATAAGHFCYWVTPTEGNDGVTERVERLPALPYGREGEAIISPAIVDRWLNVRAPYPIDAILTNNPIHGLALGHWFLSVYKGHQTAVPPVVVWNVSVKYDGGEEAQSYGWRDLATWGLGYAIYPNIMPSLFALERSRDTVRANVGPSLISAFNDTASVVYIGPATEAIDANRADRFERFSLYYGGRFTNTKGAERVVELYVQFLEGGRDADAHVTHIGKAKRLRDVLLRLGAHELVKVQSNISWAAALQLMSRCHASVYWQTLKMFPAAVFEQLYAGLVVLIRRDEYTAEFLPLDYPFLFDTEQEAAGMLRWVFENYEAAKAKVEWVPAYVKERFDRQKGIAAVIAELELRAKAPTDLARGRYALAGDTEKLWRDTFSLGKGRMTLGMAITLLKKAKPQMLITSITEAGTGMYLSEVMRFMPEEWVDTCETPEPLYVERKEQAGGAIAS